MGVAPNPHAAVLANSCVPAQRTRSARTATVAIGIFAALSLCAAIASPGFLDADACTLYMYARLAVDEHRYLVDIWGRPFCTVLYAVPATLAGRLGVRVTSLLIAIALSLVTFRIAAKQLYRQPVL